MKTGKPCLNYCWVFAVILVGLSAACVMPYPDSSGAPITQIVPESVYTDAVETLVAQLTQSSSSITPLVQPTQEASHTPTPIIIPSETSVPSPTPSFTNPGPTPTRTQTYVDTDPRLQLGTPTWIDTFDNDDNWYLLIDEHATMAVETGKLTMTAHVASALDWWALTWPKIANFYIEVSGTFGNCGKMDRFGVIVRAPAEANRGYLYALSCDGRYSLWIMDTTIPKRTVLINWTPNARIHSGSGQTNRLGLMVKDDVFSLFANGYPLDETSDSTFNNDFFGLFVGAASTIDFNVYIDEVAYWELP